MAIFDRSTIRVIAAGAGLCGVAIALSPGAAATPFVTGGYQCVQEKASGTAAPGGAACAAPLTDMAGVPLAAPGPVPAAVPPVPPAAVPPVPPVGVPPVPPIGAPPVPIGAPVAAAPAPVAAGAPLIDMAAGYGGKGQPTGPAPDGAPKPGQPLAPGPATGTR